MLSLDRVLNELFKRYQQEMPDEYCMPLSCKEGKTYDKNSEMCKKCYASVHLQAKIAEAITAKMSTEQLEGLLTIAFQAASVDDDNPRTMN